MNSRTLALLLATGIKTTSAFTTTSSTSFAIASSRCQVGSSIAALQTGKQLCGTKYYCNMVLLRYVYDMLFMKL